MTDESHEMCSYVSYDTDFQQPGKMAETALPARYRSQQNPRGGKRRKTTLAKRQKTLERLRSQDFDDEEKVSPPVEPAGYREEGGSPVDRYKIASEDSSQSSVDENYEIDSIASSIEESLTWRGRMQVALHSNWIHFVIVVLVVADALIVIFELLLDVGAFDNLKCEGETLLEQKENCHYQKFEECGPTARLIQQHRNISSSPGEGVGKDGLCTCKFRGGKRVCDDRNSGVGVNPAFVLHITSLFILTIFVVEIILKLIAFRLKYFLHKFEVFDGTIVVISYILDWASLQEEEAFEAASLVIILRLWRVVRIVNGAILSAKSQSDQQLSEARLKARKVIHAYHKAQDKMDALEEQNKKLKRELALGKVVRIPRGNFPGMASTDDDGRKEQASGTEATDALLQPVRMPEIIVTEAPSDDSSDM